MAYQYGTDQTCKTFTNDSVIEGNDIQDFQCSVKDMVQTANYLERQGHCVMIKTSVRISKYRFEGIVRDVDSCLALCERIGNECIGYEMSSITNECFTFTEDFGTMTGDGDVNSLCYQKPKTLVFDKQLGKCQRYDKVDLSDKSTVEIQSTETTEDCKQLCQSKWETCSAFQFNDSDKSCVTFTETMTMFGDHDISYDCFIKKSQALPYIDRENGFYKSPGKCKLLDRTETELVKTQINSIIDYCQQSCEEDQDCTAFSYYSEINTCYIFTETQSLLGDIYTIEMDCYYKIENLRQLYRKEAGYCKLAPNAQQDTVMYTGVEGVDTVQGCKQACDEAVVKCWGFQLLSEEDSEGLIKTCTIFEEWIKDLKGDGSENADCYIQERTTQETQQLTRKRELLQIEKATQIEHYMIAFTSKVAHLQTTLNMLTDQRLSDAMKCINKVPKAQELDDPTYEEHVANMEKIVNGFYSCILQDQQIRNIVEDGFCGPGTTEETQISLSCAQELCCGKGQMDNAGEETAVYSCQPADLTYYTPKKVNGFEQYQAITDWNFTCVSQVETGQGSGQIGDKSLLLFVSVYAMIATIYQFI